MAVKKAGKKYLTVVYTWDDEETRETHEFNTQAEADAFESGFACGQEGDGYIVAGKKKE